MLYLLEILYLCFCDMRRKNDIVPHQSGLYRESRTLCFSYRNTIIDTAATRKDVWDGRFFIC